MYECQPVKRSHLTFQIVNYWHMSVSNIDDMFLEFYRAQSQNNCYFTHFNEFT